MSKIEKIALIVILVTFFAFIIFQFIDDGSGVDNTDVKYWQEMFDKATKDNDSLKAVYDSLKVKIAYDDSLYQTKVKDIENAYEKVISGYDTLSLDGHIDELSKYLSEKDSIR